MPWEGLTWLLEPTFWLAALLAFIGGCAGNRMAWPLLGSFAFYQAAQLRAWPFDPTLWAAVDCLVLLAVAAVLVRAARKPTWRPTPADVFVVLLFAPLLASYGLAQPGAHVLSISAAILQLAVLFPARKVWRRIRSMPREPDKWNEFDLRVAA